MKILHMNARHAGDIEHFSNAASSLLSGNFKYICVIIDGPESVNREASWASDFNPDDTHKIFQALADQSK